MSGKDLTRQFNVRLSEKDYNALCEKSKAAGLPLSEYARRRLTGGRVRRQIISPEQGTQIIRELGRMGNNLNQLARHSNTTGAAADLAEIRQGWADLMRFVRTGQMKGAAEDGNN